MHARAATLIDELRLERHPEGGWYRQTFRSDAKVMRGADERSALTAIYFLLVRGERSQWHRVASDEIWTFLEGSPITLWQSERSELLAPLAGGGTPFIVVPRGEWQSAETTGDYTLVACFVAPGFEFADFEMR